MKNVLEDRTPHLLEEKRKGRNDMTEHYKPICTGLATLMSQIQKLVIFCDRNKETLTADCFAEVEKMHAVLPTLNENAEAIDSMVTDKERIVRLLMKKSVFIRKCPRYCKLCLCSSCIFQG